MTNKTAGNPNLIPYRVTLREGIVFDCMAEDDTHAAKQATSAYPQSQILTIDYFPEADDTYDAYGVNTRNSFNTAP